MVSGQQRYWDGAQWTEHTAPIAPDPSFLASQAQQYSAPVPVAPLQKNWFLRHKIITAVLVLFVVGLIGSAAGANDGSKPTASSTKQQLTSTTPSKSAATDSKPSPSSAPTPSPTPTPTQTPAPQLTAQDKFFVIVSKGQSVANDTDNEIAVVQARKARGKALCLLLPRTLRVNGWTGTIEDVSTELGGDKGVLSIDLGHGIAVETWNNSFSDAGSGTMIATNSRVYRALAKVSDGDRVKFSGNFIRDGSNCLEEQSLMDVNGMKTPDFSFKFSSVTRLS
jgi:hypothetical protein